MKRVIIWVLAFVLTILFAYYQRVTGPTYPVTERFTYAGKTIKFQYPRTHSTNSDAVVKVVMPDTMVYGFVYQRVYPLNTGYTALHLRRVGDTLIGLITQLPPAGKMQYYVGLYKGKDTVYTGKANPVVIRFKGDVPTGILLTHILFMFFALFLGVTAGLLALVDDMSFRKVQIWSFILLIIGGFIFGPIVQYHAFGQWWTGIPNGWDLTDNKTLIMLIGWLAAILANRKQARRWWTVGAALVMIIIYLIPHSLHGSTLNPATGKVISDMILSWLVF